MPTNREKLAGFLQQRPGSYFCDDCLAFLVPITNRHQVNQITGGLEVAAGEFQQNATQLFSL